MLISAVPHEKSGCKGSFMTTTFEQPLSHKSHMLLHTDHNKVADAAKVLRENRNGYVINPNAKLQG